MRVFVFSLILTYLCTRTPHSNFMYAVIDTLYRCKCAWPMRADFSNHDIYMLMYAFSTIVLVCYVHENYGKKWNGFLQK